MAMRQISSGRRPSCVMRVLAIGVAMSAMSFVDARQITAAGLPSQDKSGQSATAATTPPATAPAAAVVEVASVKQNTSAPGKLGNWRRLPGGRFTATNLSLRALIRFAYGFEIVRIPEQLVGGPDWIDTDRFDIEAKADGEIVP